MARRKGAGALRPVLLLAGLGVALAGCVGDARPARYYGGGYYGGPPGYYGSPYYGGRYGYGYGPYGYGGYDRFYGSRGYYGGPRGYYGGGGFASPAPRIQGPGTQEFLRQHWLDQARQAR